MKPDTRYEGLATLAVELNRLRTEAGVPSLRKLADMTGHVASHTTISSAFSGRAVPRWEVVQRLVAALNGDAARFQQLWTEAAAGMPRALTVEERRDVEYAARYRRYVLRRYESLMPAAPGLRPEIGLRDIYVPPTIVDHSGEASEEVSHIEFEKRIRRTLLVGAAGRGKSTLCEYLAYTHTTRGDDVALLLQFRDVVAPSGLPSLVTELIDRELEAALQTRPPQGFVERLLLNGSPLVIFDGLDEAGISGGVRRAVAIVDAFTTQYPRARILITSRPIEAERLGHDLSAFSRFTLEDFDDRQTATFVRAWFASTGDEPERDRGGEEDFLRQIALTPWVRPNPLLLTLLCSLPTIRPEPESMYSLLLEQALSRSGATSKSGVSPRGAARGFVRLAASQDDLARRLSDGHWSPDEIRLAEAILQQFQHVEPSDLRRTGKTSHSEPREVLLIRQALEREFSGLVDISDVGLSSDRDVCFLTRALAALVVRRWLRCGGATAAAHVVDGPDDHGLDAIAVSDDNPEILLVQSKWSGSGRQTFGLTDVLKFEQALRRFDWREYDQFNAKIQRHADQVAGALANPGCTIKLIMVTSGHAYLDPGAVAGLERMKQEFNFFSELLDYEVWDAQRVWQVIRDDDTPAIRISANMAEWVYLAEPVEAYHGMMSAADVAQWYEEHREGLFVQNIRTRLHRTHTRSMVDTLTTEPENFWYFNNGITVVCDRAVRHQWSHARRAPITLDLAGACVVNGAQTIAAIHTAMQEAPEIAGEAYVPVKVITKVNSPNDFKVSIARATNAQDPVTSRDFLALDPTQQAIRGQFQRILGKEYVFEHGVVDPAPVAGCTVVQAALALACAHNTSDLVVRAQRDQDLLWETGPNGAYTILFEQKTPQALRIWRAVQTLRRVQMTLEEVRAHLQGRAGSIVDSADLLIAHIVMRQQDAEDIDDPDVDWAPSLDQAAALTESTVKWLIHHLDNDFGPAAFIRRILGRTSDCERLVHLVLASATTPEAPPEYSSSSLNPERPTAVAGRPRAT